MNMPLGDFDGIRKMVIGVYRNRFMLSNEDAISRLIDDLTDDLIDERDLVDAKVTVREYTLDVAGDMLIAAEEMPE